ncbi:heme A synthase [Roseococcus sp. SYP-B2431]|uniref:COX15/CtaA family protein n=1 Tax=Roseococcus sp. SYP-B2431 TaxID=2496640 RepID=UPI00103A0235|nr:COX15/CtaA family protein [Roseococcus sp. SYP-B2431]TCH96726.1 heme A synthase [Roseococcus sp. SYP-B2431]
MPFDTRSRPALPPAARGEGTKQRAVAYWLLAVAGAIWLMIALGGATRLTGSGLSIMEWAPFGGTLPPLSEAEWRRLYDLYRTIPQYELVNAGFGIEGFKRIFWLEWAHRFWGRVIGLAYLLPFLWFWWRGAIPRGLMPRLGLLFLLGGMQGAIGWFMVASGFDADRTTVSPYRLVVHLMLALVLFAAIVWTALDLLRGRPAVAVPGTGKVRRQVLAAFWLAALTMLAGGFVAGLRAGFTYNTFPLMDGQLVPEGYLQLDPVWRNFTANIAAVQFNHRLLATLTGLAMIGAAIAAWRRLPDGFARRAVLVMAGTVAAQYVLGIVTLLHVVPPALGTAHQALAAGVLAAGLCAWHALREPPMRHSTPRRSGSGEPGA